MHICVWSLTQGVWVQTHPGGKPSGYTGCPGSRRLRWPSSAGWSVGSRSNLQDTQTHIIISYQVTSAIGYNGLIMLVLTVQELGVNVPQDVCHPQLLPGTGASMDPHPGRLSQGRAQRCDGQGSGQGRHQTPFWLFGQRSASSPSPHGWDIGSRRGVHAHPRFWWSSSVTLFAGSDEATGGE